MAKYGINPFLEGLQIKVNKVPHKESYNKSTGKQSWSWVDSAYITSVIHIPKGEIDTLPDGSKRDINDMLNNLSPSACKLLGWIERNCRYNEDTIVINPERYIEECNVSLRTFRTVITEICGQAMLSKCQGFKFRYFINPRYIHCGNRTHFKENIVYPDGTPDYDKIK